MLHVHDEFDHSLMLVEMEGEPIEYEVGVAGKFVSRRSVTFHDRTRGDGDMMGYAVTTFEEGAIYSKYKGHRSSKSQLTEGTWEVYKGVGKLANIKGSGQFTVKPGDKSREFVLEIGGDYQV
jgi:hypothetical protein